MVTITVIGLGFVGLTTALGLAELGHNVYGYDANSDKMHRFSMGNIDVCEPYLEQKLKQHLNNSFVLCDNLYEMVVSSDCFFICVGSPCKETGEADLQQVKDATSQILDKVPRDGKHRTLVIKSTVPPGTCSNIIRPMLEEHNFNSDTIGLASNPEFLREGVCWNDFINPGRIIVGSDDSRSITLLKQIYAPLNVPIYSLSTSGAEFSKYLSNVLLATLISFSNEMAYAAKCFGNIDIVSAFESLHDDHRLKNSGISSYIYPGCGYGGYCLPKDIRAFTAALNKAGYQSTLLETVTEINNNVIKRICDEICKSIDGTNTIGVLGLAFKPETDDVREAAAYYIIKTLINNGFSNIVAYDPVAIGKFKEHYPELSIEYASDASRIINYADVIVITTAWDEFKKLDFKNKRIVDGRYIIKKGENSNENKI